MTHTPLHEGDTSYKGIIRLALPLILTTSSFMLMNFVDALMLSWHSAEAIAAVLPAGMAVQLATTLFGGMAGYTAVLVSQYVGARRTDRIAPVVWQGLYVAVASGVLIAALSALGRPMFTWVGHPQGVCVAEVAYFHILCWGAPLGLVVAAVSGFFAGRRSTVAILVSQMAAFAVNAVGDWALIFGRLGAPRLGIAGAALATVAGHAAAAVVLLSLFLAPANRRRYDTWGSRRLDMGLVRTLVRYGFPNGSRYAVELVAWTAFVFFVGRLGSVELASTNIAWRINGLAFFPVIGLSQAVGILVGNAQGERRSDLSVLVTRRGLAVSQAWMVAVAACFVVFPRTLYGMFAGETPSSDFTAIVNLGVPLLRFVALYCLLDGFNIVLLSTLQSAGDTRWTFAVSLVLHVVFLAALVAVDRWAAGIMLEWVIATAFVILQAFVWLWRFLSGGWREIVMVDGGEGQA